MHPLDPDRNSGAEHAQPVKPGTPSPISARVVVRSDPSAR